MSLCISVSPHLGSGRPTKAFLSGGETRDKIHTKAADGVPPGREEEKELVESRGAAEAGEEKENTIRREGSSRARALAVEHPS